MSDGGCSVAGRNRVSPEQLDMLLTFMEEHVDFACGKTSVYSRFSASKLWRLLAERLNAAAAESGGARKSPDKWCRYWADLKYKSRKKSGGELTSADERLRLILHSERPSAPAAAAIDEEEGKMGVGGVEEASSDTSGPDRDRLPAEELLAEAAMRTALAAEKQAETLVQGVEVLRELVSLVRSGAATLALAGAATATGPGAAGGQHHHQHETPPALHHHRL